MSPSFDGITLKAACDLVFHGTQNRSGTPNRPSMHVTIVTFQLGAVTPFIETHVMEHGLYVLEGQAVYRLNADWVDVKMGNYRWVRAFCPQACYAVAPGSFCFLRYREVNRQMALRDVGKL